MAEKIITELQLRDDVDDTVNFPVDDGIQTYRVTALKVYNYILATLQLAGLLPPPGSLSAFAGSAAPTGYLLCYGQAVSRDTYANLFTAIGTAHGVGDGSTTFNLPDLRGRVIAGLDNMGGSGASRLTTISSGTTLGAAGGTQTHTLTSGEMPSHTHTQDAHVHTTSGYSGAIGSAGGTGPYQALSQGTVNHFPNTSSVTATNQNTGGGGAHQNLQPTMLLNWIIKT